VPRHAAGDPTVIVALICFLLLSTPAMLLAGTLGEPTDIAFTAEVDGSVQHYVEMLPGDFEAAKEHDALVAFHGHGSDRWQFVRDPRDECRAARDVAAKQGMIYVSPDYRAKTSWMGPKAESDTVQLIRELRTRHRIGKVILVGGSMGGTAVLTFAALHPDLVDGVCSMNGTANLLEYTNFQDAIEESFGGKKADLPLEYKNRSAEYWPERLTMPLSFTTGGKDTSVPPDSVIRLVGILTKLGRKLLLIHRENGGHSTDYEDAARALEFVLPG
jgi:pimeloyl-ACP methyl ester carboxylesterase